MSRLIVNADDLGLTAGINRAILRAHREGIVTSATLMANAPAFTEAVELLKTAPTLGVGCHLVLIDGAPVSPAGFVPSLLAPSTFKFRHKLWKFALAAARGRISSREVEVECTAQIARIQAAGIPVSHVDCHKHTHMFPAVLAGVVQAARACGVPAIRNPFEPSFVRSASNLFNAKDAVRSLETAALHRAYARNFLAIVREAGLSTTDGSIGVTITGTLDPTSFAHALRRVPAEGTYEFVCHPGYNDADLARAGTRLLASRETELAVLTSPEAVQTLQQHSVALIDFRQLARPTESKPALGHPMR